MAQAPRDQNRVTTLLAVSNADGTTPVVLWADPTTHRLLVDLPGGSGTVTSFSFNDANGFDGTVTNSTTTPELTLTTTVTNGALVKSNSGALTAAVANTDYQSPIALTTTGTSGAATFNGTTLNIPQYSNATTVTVANEATDTTCFPLFVTAATGDLGPKSNAGLTFDSSTALLTATLLAGTTSVTSATIRASSNDSGSLGASGTAFSDLFLASGALIDFAAGNSVITHSSGVLTVSTGDLRVTTAGTNSASVATLAGTQTLSNKIVSHTVEPATDDTYTGEHITGLNAGATIAQWEAVYLGSSSKWLLTDADAAATAGGVMIGLAAAAGTDTNPLTVVLRGVIRNDGWTWATVGAPLYLSTTPGAITDTAPSGTDDVIRVVGYVLTDDCIYFNPSNDWITHT